VFAINNHFGPDFGGVVRELGELLQNELIYKLGQNIHGYLGWILFTPIYAILWYLIVEALEKGRKKTIMKSMGIGSIKQKNIGNRSDSDNFLHFSYPQVATIVLAGGLNHFFIDTIGHYIEIGDDYALRGIFRLYIVPDLDLSIFYVGLYIITISFFLIRLKIMSKSQAQSLLTLISEHLPPKSIKKFLIAIIIVIINIILIVGLLSASNLLNTKIEHYSWNENSYSSVFFSIPDLLATTDILYSQAAIWYVVIVISLWSIGFFITYIRRSTLNWKGQKIRVDIVMMVGFLIIIIFGYFIQPWIGNISSEEADFGGFIFVWATLLNALGFVMMIMIEQPSKKYGKKINNDEKIQT
jgi:hypothetical protein